MFSVSNFGYNSCSSSLFHKLYWLPSDEEFKKHVSICAVGRTTPLFQIFSSEFFNYTYIITCFTIFSELVEGNFLKILDLWRCPAKKPQLKTLYDLINAQVCFLIQVSKADLVTAYIYV